MWLLVADIRQMYHVEGEVNDRGKKTADRHLKNDFESWSPFKGGSISCEQNIKTLTASTSLLIDSRSTLVCRKWSTPVIVRC